MAILNTNEMMFTAFEPKLQNRFIMYIDGIPAFLVKKVGRPKSKKPSKRALYLREWRANNLIGDRLWSKIINGMRKFLEPPFNNKKE